MEELPVIVASARALNMGERYETALNSEKFSFVADEKTWFGGQDKGPEPREYLCMALASCIVITLRMYAERKQLNLSEIAVKVDLLKAADPAKNMFRCSLQVKGELTEQQKERLIYIANVCPVHKLLASPSLFETSLEQL